MTTDLTGEAGGDAVAEAQAAAEKIPDRVLQAAATLMEREGFERASMRDIAKAAGVSKPGLYYHVDSKELLLFAIHGRFADWLLEQAEAVLASDADAETKLREFIGLGFKAIAGNRAEVAVYLHERSHLSGELRAVIDARRSRYREICEEILVSGAEAGEFELGDPHLDTLVVMGAVNWAYVWFDPDAAMTHTEVAEAFADRLLAGFRPR